jgi:lipid-binding SYLF domain-containing protein
MWNFRLSAIALLLIGAVACSTAPKTQGEQRSVEASADSTLHKMIARDPSLRQLLDGSAGYVVFAEIGKGGFIVGAAHGRGVLYESGRPVGFVELNQASLGAQLGGQTFSELIVFHDPFELQKLKHGEFTLGANASAVAIKSGAAARTAPGGVSVFTLPIGGLMAELSVSGQKLNYAPRG